MVITRSITRKWKLHRDEEVLIRLEFWRDIRKNKRRADVKFATLFKYLPECLQQHVMTFLFAFNPKFIEFNFKKMLVREPAGFFLMHIRTKAGTCGCMFYIDQWHNTMMSIVCGVHTNYKKNCRQLEHQTMHWRIGRGTGPMRHREWFDEGLKSAHVSERELSGNAVWSCETRFLSMYIGSKSYSLPWYELVNKRHWERVCARQKFGYGMDDPDYLGLMAIAKANRILACDGSHF